MIEVKYSPESLEDLQRVVEFVEVKNPYAARRIAIDLQEGFSRLKQFPEIGLLEQEIALAKSFVYYNEQLSQVEQLIKRHQDELINAWQQHFRD